jgi:hypothetical protein
MKCIDAVEGTMKTVLGEIFKRFVDERLDDSDYIREIKSILEGTEHFIRDNPEITSEPDILLEVLYSHSKDLWMERIRECWEAEGEEADETELQDIAYHNYYFDYIYHTGTYPR